MLEQIHRSVKISGGKLLNAEFVLENGIITDLKINGDFFIHPEEMISEIEKSVDGIEYSSGLIARNINETIKSKNISVIGFTAEDLADLLCRD
jgi:lipoate---protein ligase